MTCTRFVLKVCDWEIGKCGGPGRVYLEVWPSVCLRSSEEASDQAGLIKWLSDLRIYVLTHWDLQPPLVSP